MKDTYSTMFNQWLLSDCEVANGGIVTQLSKASLCTPGIYVYLCFTSITVKLQQKKVLQRFFKLMYKKVII